uniref:T9SS C-terminal target domain-containing protein n=1 Tax=Chryseobacterium endophyticum TaxID=1854762 RepID=A0AAU6WJK8_9FLAO
MTTLLKSGLLAGFLLISASLMSKDRDFSISVGNVTAKTVNFEIANAKNVSLFVYNDIEGELFSEKLDTENAVMKSYNLEDLASGTYYLVAESETKVEKYRISINSNNAMEVEKTPVSSVNKPEYSISGNMVRLHMTDIKNSVNISVYDFSNNLFYTANKNGENGELNMTLDLDPKTSSNYIIRVEENGNVFNKIIPLR